MCTFVVQLGSYWIARKSPWFLIIQVIVIEKSLSSVFVQELDLTTYFQFKKCKKNRSNLNIMMHETSTIAWYSPPHIETRLCLRRTCKFHGSRHGTPRCLNVFMLVYDSDFFFISTLALFDGLQDALWRAGRPASQPFLCSSTSAGQDMIWYDLIGYMLLYRWSKQIAASKNNNVQWLMVSILSTSEQKFLDGGGHCAGCTQLVWDLCRSEGRRTCIINCDCIKGLSQPRFPQVAESVICYLHWHHFAVCTLQAWKNQPAVLDETLET